MDAEETVRAYYAHLDDERYDDLRDLLAPGFTQHRPDRTFDGRDEFLSFMTRKRPHTDTTHVLDGVFHRDPAGDGPTVVTATSTDRGSTTAVATPTPADETETVLARGTVERESGDVVVRFVDCFAVLADRIVSLETYTR
jgi:ketosteroid isomerase-like protein